MKIATGVGKFMEQAMEGSKIRMITFDAQTGNRVSKESKIFSDFSASEGKEKSVIVGNDFVDSFKRNGLISKTNNVVIRQRVP